MQNISGYLMSGDCAVAEIHDDVLTVILNQDLLPLYFRTNRDLETWVRSRAIDSDRINSRLLKKALQLQNKDDLSVALAVRASCITDNYWIKLTGDSFNYDDIRFKTDVYSDLALSGDLDVFSQHLNKFSSHTPELTNIGSFEKGWKLIDGVWWLNKQGNSEQIFSELFCEQLGHYLGMNMAVYRLNKGYIMSKDFTEQKTNFQPAFYLIGDQSENYSLNYHTLFQLSSDYARQYLDILYLDAIVRNPDRHEFNYGVLSSQRTGEVLSLAPNFDNNLALISTGYPKNLDRSQDRMIAAFVSFLNHNQIAYEPVRFTESILSEIIKAVPIAIETERVVRFLMNGQEAFFNAARLKGADSSCDFNCL